MKKITSMLLISAVILSIAGCGGTNQEVTTTDTSVTTTTLSATTTTEENTTTTTEATTTTTEVTTTTTAATTPESTTVAEESTTVTTEGTTTAETTATTIPTQSTTVATQTTTGVNVRAGAGTNYGILGKLSSNQSVTVVGTSGDWYAIEYNGDIGYVLKSYLSKNKATTTTTASQTTTTTSQPTVSATEQMAQEIIDEIITSGMSEFDKALAIHDWLTFNVDYDLTYSYYHAEELFTYRYSVCNGYAEAFEIMADLAGLDVNFISGTADNGSGGGYAGHAWNQVKIDGIWYNVDTTWDDPSNFQGSNEANRYTYFLISDSTIGVDHKTSDSDHVSCPKDYDRETIYEKAIATGIWGVPARSEAELREIMATAISEGKTEFNVFYYDADITNDEKKDLIFDIMYDLLHVKYSNFSCGLSYNSTSAFGECGLYATAYYSYTE